jgi:hypothetical protein
MQHLDTHPRFAEQAEARGNFFSVTIVPTDFKHVPFFAYREGGAGNRLPSPGIPSRGGAVLGTAGILGAEELAQALERAAAALRAAVAGSQGQTGGER